MQAIRILCVGGTIDKVYFDALSEYEVGVPYALEMLEELNLNLDCRVTSLMRKDSLEMDDADRELVRDAAAPASLAQYNDPLTNPVQRRNDVLIKLESFDVGRLDK